MVTVNVCRICKHMSAVIDIGYSFSVYICDAHQISAAVAELFLFAGGSCDRLKIRQFSIAVLQIGQYRLPACPVCDSDNPVVRPGYCQDISVFVFYFYQITVAEQKLVILLIMDHKLFCRICMDRHIGFGSGFVQPFLFFCIIIKIVNCAVSIHMLVIICPCDFQLFQSLVIAECKSIAVSQIHSTVIGIIHMRKAHRHQTSSGCHSIMDQDQISVVIIDMDISGSAHALAVVAPVILQSGIIHIGNLDPWTHILISVITVCRKEFCISGQFLVAFEHQPAILIPVFYHPSDIQRNVFLCISFISTQILHYVRIKRLVIPVNGIVMPALKNLVYGNGTLFSILCQRNQY